jgi:hypothetical protein
MWSRLADYINKRVKNCPSNSRLRRTDSYVLGGRGAGAGPCRRQTTQCSRSAWKVHIEIYQKPQVGYRTFGELISTFLMTDLLLLRDLINNNEVRFIDPLDEQSQNVVCLVKLVMVVALRFAHVQDRNSSKEVLEHTSKRRDRTVQWTRPTWPIICQMPRGKQLPVQEPGGAYIANRSIKNLALVGGVLGRVSSHAACNGAIRDTAYIKQKIQGVAKSAVIVAAGYTEQATASGLTRAYVGSLQQTLYNMRAADPLQDRLAPVVAELPANLHRLQLGELDKYMDDYEMKRTDLKLRRVATGRFQKERIGAWEKQERDREAYVHNTPYVALPNRNLLPGTGKVILPTSTNNVPANNITANIASPRPSSNSREAALTSTQGVGTALSEKDESLINVSRGRIYADKETRGEKEIPIDPYLPGLDQNPNENVGGVDQNEYKALT